MVLVDRVIENNVFDVVTSNNYDAMTELVKYLYYMEYTAFRYFYRILVPHGSARIYSRCKCICRAFVQTDEQKIANKKYICTPD